MYVPVTNTITIAAYQYLCLQQYTPPPNNPQTSRFQSADMVSFTAASAVTIAVVFTALIEPAGAPPPVILGRVALKIGEKAVEKVGKKVGQAIVNHEAKKNQRKR